MNLSKLQVDCLNAMGIELWQSRAIETSGSPAIIEPVADARAQPPSLVAQLECAIDYCQQHCNDAVKLSWKIDDRLEQVELANTQLLLPALTRVFASTKLKQQLWNYIHQANK